MEELAIPAKKKSKVLKWVLIANVILWSTLIILLVYTAPKDPPATPQKLAYTMACKVIEDNLKVPDSAQYQPYSEDLVITAGNTYQVNMWVISKNAFGVNLRSNFSVTVKDDGENWYLIHISEE